MLAALLYLGAGVGMTLLSLICPVPLKDRLTRRQLPFTLGMILLDIAAPILLMLGLARAPAAHVSLLNNFEIVATSLLAFLLNLFVLVLLFLLFLFFPLPFVLALIFHFLLLMYLLLLLLVLKEL